FRLQNIYNMRGERSISADDQPHRFVASYTYDLPWGAGRRYLNRDSLLAKLFGSWQISGMTLLRSGLPFGVDSTQHTTDPPAGRQRRNRTKYAPLPANPRSIPPWSDTPPFSTPPQFTFGNSARNVVRAPGRVNFDVMLAKHIAITERVRFDFRTEAFN